MKKRNAPYQPPGSPVFIGQWERSQEFGTFPVGSKPKQMVICPVDATEPFLIAGHAYLFKWAEGWQEQQIWSEIIAYRIACLVGLDVPKCFLAVDETVGRVGALVEFFYGYPGDVRTPRFIPAAEVLRLKDPKKGRPHDVRTNMRFANRFQVKDAVDWWGRALLFDALIGNTDRHPENWGMLFSLPPGISIRHDAWKRLIPFLKIFDRFDGSGFEVKIAPVFDNGTSLGYEIREAALSLHIESAQLKFYIDRGTHHCGWSAAEPQFRHHVELCRRYLEAFPAAGAAMGNMLQFRQEQIDSILRECVACEVEPKFTAARAEFVSALIRERHRRLMRLFED